MVHGKYAAMRDDSRRTRLAVDLLLPGGAPRARAAVTAALEWAAELYGTAEREDGRSVMSHAYDVARNMAHFGRQDVETILVALLHDVLETTDTAAAELERRFGARVAGLVVALTNEPGEDPATSARRAVQAGPEAVFLRLCDRLDGLRHAAQRRDLESRRRFLTSTREVYLPLALERFPEIAAEMAKALAAEERTLQ